MFLLFWLWIELDEHFLISNWRTCSPLKFVKGMAPVTIQLNERTMYDLDWLEDCYKRVKFPNPKCEELLVEVNEGLSHKITGELDNQVKQQALFQLLGEDYVRIHFPHHKFNPKIFHEANPELKKAYTKDMKQMIDRQLDITLTELGYPEDVR